MKNWLKSWLQRVVAKEARYGWQPPTSGVPQGSILGQFLFNVFSNYLGTWVECTITVFGDDTKLGGDANSLEEQETLQRDLNRLEHWAVINEIKFNKLKCQILYLGWSNAVHKNHLGEQRLESSPAEKDLGGAAWQQCALAVKRANCILSYIKHCITRQPKEVIILLYAGVVSP